MPPTASSLTNVAGPGTFTVNGGAITATTRALDVDDDSGNVTIGATLTTSGTAARSVEVTNRDGGTVDINGLVTDTSQGINLSTNGTGLVRFDGGITASTGTNTAFNATGGGNIAVTDTNAVNQITGFTGTGINLNAVAIGADGVTLNTVSTGAGGAAIGISLMNVAGPGTFTVNGGSITATIRGLDVDGGSGNVTIGATLTTSGTAARSVEVTNRTGGTVDINGLVTDSSLGINLRPTAPGSSASTAASTPPPEPTRRSCPPSAAASPSPTPTARPRPTTR